MIRAPRRCRARTASTVQEGWPRQRNMRPLGKPSKARGGPVRRGSLPLEASGVGRPHGLRASGPSLHLQARHGTPPVSDGPWLPDCALSERRALGVELRRASLERAASRQLLARRARCGAPTRIPVARRLRSAYASFCATSSAARAVTRKTPSPRPLRRHPSRVAAARPLRDFHGSASAGSGHGHGAPRAPRPGTRSRCMATFRHPGAHRWSDERHGREQDARPARLQPL